MSALSNISEFDTLVPNAFDEVITKRQKWPETSDVILGAMEEAAGLLKELGARRPIRCFKFGRISHLGGVQFQFGDRPNGLSEDRNGSSALGMELGAVLVFGQTESGRIQVYAHPFEDFLPFQDSARKTRPYYGPLIENLDEITPEDVHQIIYDFLAWSDLSSPFGVKHPQIKSRIKWSTTPPTADAKAVF